MSFYKSDDGLKIFYKHENKISKKSTILFVHCWGGNWTLFNNEISFFKEKGYPVLYLDLRGHGLSDKPKEKKKYNLELIAKDILGILNKEKIKKTHIVGYSLGGMVSSIFAYKYEERLNSLIIIDSSYENPLFSSKLSFFYKHQIAVKYFCDWIINNTSTNSFKNFNQKEFDISKIKNKSDIKKALEMVMHTPLHVIFTALESMLDYNLKGKLKKIKIPTLIIGSDKDQVFSLNIETEFKDEIPNSKFILEKGTHFLPISNPREITKQINLFLNEINKLNKKK